MFAPVLPYYGFFMILSAIKQAEEPCNQF